MVIVRRRLEKRYDMFKAASSPKKRPASATVTSKTAKNSNNISKAKSSTPKSKTPAKKRRTAEVAPPVPTLEPISTRRSLRRKK